MSQNQEVLFWLKQGNSLSQAEAISKFGCYRLGARIYDLRKSGAKIDTTNGRETEQKWQYGSVCSLHAWEKCVSRKKLLECEARQWLAWGYATRQKVNELMKKITEQRGRAAADELREEMRRQYR